MKTLTQSIPGHPQCSARARRATPDERYRKFDEKCGEILRELGRREDDIQTLRSGGGD